MTNKQTTTPTDTLHLIACKASNLENIALRIAHHNARPDTPDWLKRSRLKRLAELAHDLTSVITHAHP